MDFSFFEVFDQTVLEMMGSFGNLFVDTFAQLMTNGWTWVPLYVFLFVVVIKNNESMAQIGLIIASALLCVLFSGVLSDLLVKPMTMRLRPLNDPALTSIITTVEELENSSYSFFSSHAANTFSLAIFFSLLIGNRWFTMVIVAWSLINCWTRIYLYMHFPSDVLVGLLWGGTVGAIVYFFTKILFTRLTSNLHFISSQYTRTGYALTDVSAIIKMVFGTIIVAIFLAFFTIC